MACESWAAATRGVRIGSCSSRGRRGGRIDPLCRSATASSTRGEERRVVQRPVGARGGRPGAFLRPAVARTDHAQLRRGRNSPSPARTAPMFCCQLWRVQDNDRRRRCCCRRRDFGHAGLFVRKGLLGASLPQTQPADRGHRACGFWPVQSPALDDRLAHAAAGCRRRLDGDDHRPGRSAPGLACWASRLMNLESGQMLVAERRASLSHAKRLQNAVVGAALLSPRSMPDG